MQQNRFSNDIRAEVKPTAPGQITIILNGKLSRDIVTLDALVAAGYGKMRVNEINIIRTRRHHHEPVSCRAHH